MLDQIKEEAQKILPELNEAESLMHEVRRLLVHSEGALEAEGVKDHAEKLEHWLESYRRGLTAAQKLSKNGDAFLHEMRDKLKLAMHEMHRLEDEGGGLVDSKDQKQRTDDMARAIERIDHLINSLHEAPFKLEPEAA